MKKAASQIKQIANSATIGVSGVDHRFESLNDFLEVRPDPRT